MKINVINEQNIKKVSVKKIRDISKYILSKEFKEGPYSLNILLCDNMRIKELNENYRRKEGPTDVLSFAYGLNEPVIGDIVISVQRIEEQAKDYGNSFEQEFYYNLIHSLLHILGYDHETSEEDKKHMFELQDSYFSVLITQAE